MERASSAVGGDCSCNTALCQIFQQGYFYLYPFNIEYSLFASTMLYVMWKNVGRLLASSTPGHSHAPSPVSLFRETFFAGPVLGLMLFVVGLAVFIIYEVQVSGEQGRTQQALVTYYSFNIVCLGLMTLVSLSGSVIYRFDRRAMDQHKKPYAHSGCGPADGRRPGPVCHLLLLHRGCGGGHPQGPAGGAQPSPRSAHDCPAHLPERLHH